MKIVVLSDWFAERMGYAENLLPKALARQGAEVHLITSDLQPDLPNYKETYEPFLGPRLQRTGSWQLNGFTLHRLPHGSERQGIALRGLYGTLNALRPDIVQTFTLPSLSTYQAAVYQPVLNYRLFLEEHIHRSVFAPRRKGKFFFAIFKRTIGPLLGVVSERCYPIAPDVAEIVCGEFGYPARKVRIVPLGVDLDVCFPPETEELRRSRSKVRQGLGFTPDDIVCVYSGRFHEGKGPQILARAIELARKTDRRFKGLFIGSGTVEEVGGIVSRDGCVTHPFVDSAKLPELFRAGDIGVWPKQESTSQLDAAACGLPIIVSDRVEARERVEGNGLQYVEGDAADLAARILELREGERRRELGDSGARKMREHYSWDAIARDRINDYANARGE